MKLTNLKSNKALAFQDAVIAIMIIMLFTGIIGTTTVGIYKIQVGTKIDSIASLLVVQIMERIDKLGYAEVTNENMGTVIENMRNDFSIPKSFNIDIKIEPDSTTDALVKTVFLQLEYTSQKQDRVISVRTLKVKEFEGETNEK